MSVYGKTKQAWDKLATGQHDNQRERTYRPYRNINKANTSNSVNNTFKKRQDEYSLKSKH